MIVLMGWLLFALGCALSVGFGVVLWRFWLHSTMSAGLRYRAIGIYALGCLLCLALIMLQPL